MALVMLPLSFPSFLPPSSLLLDAIVNVKVRREAIYMKANS